MTETETGLLLGLESSGPLLGGFGAYMESDGLSNAR